jgi:hypothetical protein
MNNHELKLSFVVEQMVSDQTKTTTPIEKQMAKQNVGTTNVLNPNASLSFNGDTLTWMTNGTPIKQWNAISGLTVLNAKPNQWGNMVKRITTQPEVWSKDKNMGPTPPGNYVLGSLESRKGGKATISKFKATWLAIKDGSSGKWNDSTQDFNADTIYSQISWGNFRSPVIAAKGTNTFGRGGFYLHGGTIPGSHGCIDLTDNMDDFAKFYGTWLAGTKKNSIALTVDYGAKNEIVKDVWEATSTTPTTGATKTNVATTQPTTAGTKTNVATTQPTSQPVSEPIAKPVTKPLPKPATSNVFAQLGTRGPVVTNLQTKLKQLNYNLGPKGIDGKFGYDTQRAVVQFQKDNGLKPDGVFGPETNKKLNISSVQPPAKNEFM